MAKTAPPVDAAPKPWIGLCAAGSAPLADAQAKYDELDQWVEQLDPLDPPDEFHARFDALLDHECFALAQTEQPFDIEETETGLEAKRFWSDGADMWLRQYLDLAAGDDRTAWFSPTPRKAWTAKTHPDHPLAQFLCSANPEDPCAAAVLPWSLRASRFYELWTNNPGANDDDCEDKALSGPSRDAYATWRECERGNMSKATVLPIGGLGVVDEGWLVIQGRRGHYGFCDGVAAYDLDSGAAFRFESCSSLSLYSNGSVDHRGTDAGRRAKVTVGTIPVPAVREAAWATLSTLHTQDDVIIEYALGRQVPEGIRIGRVEPDLWGIGIGGAWSSSHTTLDWMWAAKAKDAHVNGDLSWPDSLDSPAKDHAVRLLAIAEVQLEPGCAPAKLPRWLVDKVHEASVSGIDADEQSLLEAEKQLSDAIFEQSKRGACPPPR